MELPAESGKQTPHSLMSTLIGLLMKLLFCQVEYEIKKELIRIIKIFSREGLGEDVLNPRA